MDITWLLQSSIQCSSQCVHFFLSSSVSLILFIDGALTLAHTHTMHGLAYDHWLCRWITQFATITDNPIWTLCDDLKKWQTREIFGLIRKKWFWNEWNISYNSFAQCLFSFLKMVIWTTAWMNRPCFIDLNELYIVVLVEKKTRVKWMKEK